MSHVATSCPKCDSEHLTDNGGTDGHTGAHALHFVAEGLLHASPLKLVLGTGGLAARLLNPRKFTCVNCGHVFKA
jgi:hypothetical protein